LPSKPGMSVRRFVSIGCSIGLLIGESVISGCAYYSREPIVESRGQVLRVAKSVPEYYTVARGDTLYSIAWRYGLDFRSLATRNGLYQPYRIYAGSRLRLRSHTAADLRYGSSHGRDSNDRSGPANASTDPHPASVERRSSVLTGNGGHRSASGVDWHWPVRGQVTAPAADSEKFGVEILGSDGTAIHAAAPGEVVYSGDRLIGYGKLIIIRHNDAYLSAYGNNRRLLVTEGLRVAAGQEIAEMGHSGNDRAKLYFEIRRNGKPVPPLDYLP
jgi:lipoprotein NlpD